VRLVGHHGGIRDQQRIERAAVEPQPTERPRRQELILVLEDRPAADGPGVRADFIVDEVHDALVRPIGLIGELDAHRVGRIARGAALAADAQPCIADVVGFRTVEHEIDRVQADDGRQQRCTVLATGDQIAGIDAPIRNPPADGRADLGPFQIELRRMQCSLCRHLSSPGDVEVGLALIEFANGGGGGLHQLSGALVVRLIQHDLRLCPHHVGLR
jgi:hypothetical protein